VLGIAEGLNCVILGANSASAALGAVIVIAAVLVVLGLFTSYSASAIAIATLWRVLAFSHLPCSVLLKGPGAAGMLVVLGVALTLLGPGLFSLDFRLFGRREIVVPRRTRG
jgi:uncharacterized membrane protein YphA (DoxX/SURF4 family)